VSALARIATARLRWTLGIAVLALGGLATLALGLRNEGRSVDPVAVRRGDLVQTVAVEGELAAARSVELGPPSIGSAFLWQFKIAFMAPESSEVKAGQPVIGFDTQPVVQQLDERRAELAEVTKKIEQRQIDLDRQLLDLDQRLAQTEAELAKARLKADVPSDLVARIEAQKATLELGAKERALASLRAEREAVRAGIEAELRTLNSQKARSEGRVAALEAGIQAMTVRAPQDGIVIYKTDWRDEKKKIGDSLNLMEKAVSLPDLSELKALGDVDEADAGQVTLGQKVTLRLEARLDLDLAARVAKINRTVRRKSWRVPSKVYRVELALERTDPTFMRPAMRFRGEIETARFPGCLLVPSDAVFLRTGGPVVWVRTRMGWSERPVTLGRRGARTIEVISGLANGERIAPFDLVTEPAEGRHGPGGPS
jgi:HlyD family secretion protein